MIRLPERSIPATTSAAVEWKLNWEVMRDIVLTLTTRNTYLLILRLACASSLLYVRAFSPCMPLPYMSLPYMSLPIRPVPGVPLSGAPLLDLPHSGATFSSLPLSSLRLLGLPPAVWRHTGLSHTCPHLLGLTAQDLHHI